MIPRPVQFAGTEGAFAIGPKTVIGVCPAVPEMTGIAQYLAEALVPNVVFACGAIADEREDLIWVYYGGGDMNIGLASGSLSGLVEACVKRP